MAAIWMGRPGRDKAMRTRMTHLGRVVLVAAAVMLGRAGTASAAPITVGSFSWFGDEAFVDLSNLTGSSSDFFAHFGESANLTGTLQVCGSASDLNSCSAAEIIATGPASGSWSLNFLTDPSFDPTVEAIRVAVSIALESGSVPAGTLSVTGNGFVSLSCDESPGNPCTQFIEFTPATAVPEPATLALFATGLGTLMLRRNRHSYVPTDSLGSEPPRTFAGPEGPAEVTSARRLPDITVSATARNPGAGLQP